MGLTARLAEFLAGYAVFRVSGPGLEPFLNACAREGIPVHAVRRLGERVAVGRIPASQFRRLRRPARRARLELHLVERGGWPFVWQRVKRRPGLLAGSALAVALVAFLGSHVWEVRVRGPAEVDRETVREALTRMGFRPGVSRGDVDPDRLEQALLLAMPHLAWAEVRLQGSVLEVEVRPRRDHQAGELAAGDVVATYDALVTHVAVAAGWAVVQPGDVVRRGQVLISGRAPAGAGPARPLRARGRVTGRVWAEGYGESALSVTVNRPGSRAARGWALRVGPWRLHAGAVDPPFQRFEARPRSYRLPGAAAGLPVELVSVLYREMHPLAIPLEPDQAARLAEEAAFERAVERLGPAPQLLGVEGSVWQEEPGGGPPVVRSRVVVEALQEIGRFVPYEPPPPGARAAAP